MKHKFVKTEGCTAFGFTVDGELIDDIPKDKQYEILDDLMEKIWLAFEKEDIGLQDIVEMFECDDHKYEKKPCDQCGDTVSWTTWEI
jgi:hypothetical protein